MKPGQIELDFQGYVFLDKNWIYNHVTEFKVGHIQVDNTCIVNFYRENRGEDYTGLTIEDMDFSGESIFILNTHSDMREVSLKASPKAEESIRRIALKVGGELRQSHWELKGGWYRLDKSRMSDPWPGIPEPSTYGAAFSFSALAVGIIRRRKKRRADSLNPPRVRA